MSFDISNARVPGAHIKLAIGLDYLDACPVRGVRLGGGDEELSTAAQVKAAAAAVKTYLKNTLGVDTTNLPDDPVGATLVAAVSGGGGNAFDKVLDDIQAKLKLAGKTLSGAAGEVMAGAGGAKLLGLR